MYKEVEGTWKRKQRKHLKRFVVFLQKWKT